MRLTREQIQKDLSAVEADLRKYRAHSATLCWNLPAEQFRTLCTLALRGLDAEWRPIAEAPKDGTLVDLWDGEKRITECHYDSAWPKSVGWCGPRDLVNGCRIVNIHPTHFMPLPTPPKEA